MELNGGTNEAVVFTGTLSNTSPTDLVFLNNAQFTFTGSSTTNLTADTNAFFANVPGILLPGETYSDTVFAMALNGAAAAGDYFGAIAVQGGTNIFATDNLAGLSFEVATYAGLTVNPATYQRPAGLSLKVMISDLLTNAGDAGTDAVALAGVTLVTTNGVTLATNNVVIYYTNSAGFNAADSFSYTVSDTVGRTATGAVFITVVSGGGSGQSQTVTMANNRATVIFAGIPALQYVVQRSTNLTDWVSLLTTNAPAFGLMQIEDDFSDLAAPPVQAYYRLTTP